MNSIFKDVLLLNKSVLNRATVRYFRTKGFTRGHRPGQASTIQEILRRLYMLFNNQTLFLLR